MSLTPVRASLAATLAAALLLTGCSDDGEPEGDRGSREPSSETTPEDPASASEDGTPAAGGELTADNIFATVLEAQQEAGSYRGTGTTTAAGMTISQDIDVVFEDGEMFAHATTRPDSDQQMEAVVAAGVMYLRGDAIPAPGGKWVTIDPSDPEVAASPLAALGAAFDPAVALQVLDDPKEVTVVGEETVEGVATTHYRVVIDAATYGEAFELPDEALATLPAELPFDLWVDEDNLLVKQSQSFDINGQPFANEQVYSDYGADITVDVPDLADTISITELS